MPFTISASELSWEAFQPGGYTVVAFEAISTVSWKGPQAGQGPSRSLGLLSDRGYPALGIPKPSAHPGTTMSLAAAKSPVPSGSIISPPLPCTCFPLVLDFLPHSHLHVPGWDRAAPQPCVLTLSLPPSLFPPLSLLSILVCLYRHLEFPGLAQAQSLNYGHNEKWCIRPAAS